MRSLPPERPSKPSPLAFGLGWVNPKDKGKVLGTRLVRSRSLCLYWRSVQGSLVEYAGADKELGGWQKWYRYKLHWTKYKKKTTTTTTIPEFKAKLVIELKEESMWFMIFHVFIMGHVISSLGCHDTLSQCLINGALVYISRCLHWCSFESYGCFVALLIKYPVTNVEKCFRVLAYQVLVNFVIQ